MEVYEQPGQTVETVPFSDRPIRVSRGGCHHFGESWSVAVSEGVKPWKAVRKMRQRVTVKRDADIDKCLEALPADEPTDFSLGEITSCGVTIDEGVLTAYFTVAI